MFVIRLPEPFYDTDTDVLLKNLCRSASAWYFPVYKGKFSKLSGEHEIGKE